SVRLGSRHIAPVVTLSGKRRGRARRFRTGVTVRTGATAGTGMTVRAGMTAGYGGEWVRKTGLR
ncbi:hypothetical protein, partial [Streptomyces sp. NPDC059873]|uniref:hypothetical protein n=1 Tax=Streptomyces sp. NPDC059873 TaxID=3346982 RepID=UPI00364687BC